MYENNLIDWSKVSQRKISVRIGGHTTSVSLEQPFLDVLKAIAYKKGQSLAFIITEIDSERPQKVNLSAALRVYVLQSVLTQRL